MGKIIAFYLERRKRNKRKEKVMTLTNEFLRHHCISINPIVYPMEYPKAKSD